MLTDSSSYFFPLNLANLENPLHIFKYPIRSISVTKLYTCGVHDSKKCPIANPYQMA